MDRSYRVLHVTPFFQPDKGGIANHVSNLCSKLSDLGNDISVASPRRICSPIRAPSQDPKKSSLPCVYLPGWPYPTLRSVSIPIDFGRQLDSVIRTGKFDIIHAHGHHYPTTWMALNSAIKHHIPSVLTMHGMYALNPNVLGGKSWLEELFNKYIFKKVLFRTSAVIGLTKQITDYARLYSGQHVKFFTIPNGVNVSTYKENIARKFQYRQKYNIDARSKVIIFVGRFEKVKGILEFVSAIKLIYGKGSNQIETIIVGEGGLEREVNSMVSGTAGIHLFGWQTSQIIHEFYLAADIFVIPSKFEALPLTIIEAMNAHLHIVYTPVGGIPDVLEKYEAKTLLDEPSVERIATVLSSLLGNHPSDEHDANSFIYAEEFDWKNIADNVNLVYQELCKS